MEGTFWCTQPNSIFDVQKRMGEGEAGTEPATVMSVFQKTVDSVGDSPAIHFQKKGEPWQTWTWREYQTQVFRFAKSLINLNFQPFQSVNIIGFNSKEWFVADLGCIAAGGIAAGIYTTNGPDACQYISEHSDAFVVVVEGKAQLEKFLSIKDRLPALRALVVYDENDVSEFKGDDRVAVYTWDEFMDLGKEVGDDAVQQRIDAQVPGNCCTLIYTSGTTGPPKAVMISHDNVTWVSSLVVRNIIELGPDDVEISYLPLSHIAAQILDIHGPMVRGSQIYFAQPDALKGSLSATLQSVRPTIFFGVPRVWEKIAEKMWAIGRQTTGCKKTLATWAKRKGSEWSASQQVGATEGAPSGFGCAHSLVLSKIKGRLGLDRCKACFTGAAPIPREVLDYFASLSIPIYELFGQSECTGPQTMNFPGNWKIGTCGRSMIGTTLQIVPENGEIIYSGRHIMMGYMKNPDSSRETIDEQGFLHSGDVGKVDEDGFLSITGRIKELIITAGGENIPPVLIEDKIKEKMRCISNAMVIGDKRKYLVVLLTLKSNVDAEGEPTTELVADALEVAQEIGSEARTTTDAINCPKFAEYINKGIEQANKDAASQAQTVKKFRILERDFSVGGGDLTPTLKLKRKVVSQKYDEVIEALYAGAE